MQTSPTKGEFVFEDRDAKQVSVEMAPLPSDTELIFGDAAQQTPLYRQQPNELLWYKYLPESKTVYFQFRGYPPDPEFSRFSAELLQLIEKNPIDRLVIDLRSNSGGDEAKFQSLLEGIIGNARINRKGHLFVIIGRATYSAGMLNAVQLKLRTNAILFGEPTGAKPNQYNESSGDKALKLPNSGLKVDYSIRNRQLLKHDSPALMPDVRVTLSSSDYIAGRDPVLEKILAYDGAL
jgi:C-terminal processing protease CtpA/Prc